MAVSGRPTVPLWNEIRQTAECFHSSLIICLILTIVCICINYSVFAYFISDDPFRWAFFSVLDLLLLSTALAQAESERYKYMTAKYATHVMVELEGFVGCTYPNPGSVPAIGPLSFSSSSSLCSDFTEAIQGSAMSLPQKT